MQLVSPFWLKCQSVDTSCEILSLLTLVPRISAHKLRLLAGLGASFNCGKKDYSVFALSLGAAILSHLNHAAVSMLWAPRRIRPVGEHFVGRFLSVFCRPDENFNVYLFVK